MVWKILCIGNVTKGAEYDVCQRYITRCKTPITITQVEHKKSQSEKHQKNAEADLLLRHLSDNTPLIALDERGETIPSSDFAQKIESYHIQGAPHIAFAIGGAFGLSQRIRERADFVLSFGKLTLPHMMVRAILCEQLYRVQTILDGHPYHKV